MSKMRSPYAVATICGPLITKWSQLGMTLARGEAWGIEYKSKARFVGVTAHTHLF